MEQLPVALPDKVEMSEANAPIVIYEGEYILKGPAQDIKLTGRIFYNWLPSRGLRYSGVAKEQRILGPDLFNKTFHVIIQGMELGSVLLTKLSMKTTQPSIIEGFINSPVFTGDKNISVEKVNFSVPNFQGFIGQCVRRKTFSGSSICRDRLVFEDDNYQIILEKHQDFTAREENLKKSGGYHILYNGELSSKKGKITHLELKDLIRCFSSFLSFINGRRTSVHFVHGIKSEKIIWTDYSNYYFVHPYKHVSTWALKHPIETIEMLWKNFRTVWTGDPEDQDALHLAVLWFTEANVTDGIMESSIISAQNALELLYNRWIIEKDIKSTRKRSRNAAVKIRNLILETNTSFEIPYYLNKLKIFQENLKNAQDAPDAIVFIRNAIIHSDEYKRKKMNELDSDYSTVLYQALQVYLWYIELSLLHILGYKGKYFNRCTNCEDEIK